MSTNSNSLAELLGEAEYTRATLEEVKDRKAQMNQQFDDMIAQLEAKLSALLGDDQPTTPSTIGRML